MAYYMYWQIFCAPFSVIENVKIRKEIIRYEL